VDKVSNSYPSDDLGHTDGQSVGWLTTARPIVMMNSLRISST